MLVVMFRRVKTGDPDKPENNYVVRVQINETPIATGQVLGHRYHDGWRALVQRFLDEGGGQDSERAG